MSKSLGKRKEREGEVELPADDKAHGATVFVSNLPYSATSTDLNTLFSDVGPVRSSFVVLDPASGISKGVGYVAFAIREDAQAAYDAVHGGEGLTLDGRKLRVDWAGVKPHKDRKEKTAKVEPASDEKPAKKAHAPKFSHPSGPSDPLAIRKIVVSGLPSGIDSKVLWKKLRKYDGAEKVEWPITVSGIEDASTAHVLFSTPATAQAAVTKLHAHVFKGALLSVTLKKRLDGLAKGAVAVKATDATAGKPSKGPAPSRASRLIVRNLPFDITEQDLRAVFLPYGPIHSIHIPTERKDVKKKEEPDVDADDVEERPTEKPRTKGYAFVWMLSKKDAEHALEGANGARVRAGMADGMVRDKQKKKKVRREEAKLKLKEKERKAREARQKKTKTEDADEAEDDEEEKEGQESDDESEAEDEGEGDIDPAERVIAVDWALSKDKWEEAKAKLQEEAKAEGDEGEEQEGEASDNDESESEDEDDEGSHIGVHDERDSDADEDDDEDDEMDVDGDDESKPGKPTLPETDVGTTLFVRNVPFEASEDDLRTTFRAFGPLRYARITMDHDTGRSRGTGFVCFWNKEDADKAIEQSQLLHEETTGAANSAAKKNPFKLPSLLTPDPSASAARNLVLNGRTLDVTRAVTRDEATKLKEAGERQREKADKRNLYLLREGIIHPNMPAAQGIPAAELEKRAQSFDARKALLRSNPSLYVSRTRLSIRQIPLFVSERTLKRLAIHAVRTFEAEVKDGSRKGLTVDELTEPAPEPEDGDEEDQAGKGKGKTKPAFGKGKGKFGRSTGVKQTKIVRQQDRVEVLTGKGRSRGYGFVEMEKHADALRVLRWANNNPVVGKLFDEWYKEELKELLEREKKAEKKDEAKIERIKSEMEQGTAKKAKAALIVEFSIENVQVVKRRAARQEEQGVEDPKKRTKKVPMLDVKREAPEKDGPPRKKRKATDTNATVKDEKSGDKLGGLIGRKRKQRKERRKA